MVAINQPRSLSGDALSHLQLDEAQDSVKFLRIIQPTTDMAQWVRLDFGLCVSPQVHPDVEPHSKHLELTVGDM